jgi:hypothetical protein
VRGVVGAHEEVATRVREAASGARQVGPYGLQVVPVVLLQRGRHRQNRERDLGMLVRAQPTAGLPHHLEEAERGAVGAVGQDADVSHASKVGSALEVGNRRAHSPPGPAIYTYWLALATPLRVHQMEANSHQRRGGD